MNAREELKEKLEAMLDIMVQKGLITEQACNALKKESAPGKGDSPLDSMVNELDTAGVEHRDIYNPHLQNKIMGMFTAKALGLEPIANAFLQNLKNPDLRNEETPALDKLRLQVVTIAATLVANQKANAHLLNTPSPDLGLLAKQMMLQYKKVMQPAIEKKFGAEKDQKSKELDELCNGMESQLIQSLRNLFGGDNPCIAGEIQFPVLGPIFGNLFGATNQTTPDENSVAHMVQSNTYNPNMPDDLGLESSLKSSGISQGGLIDAVATMTEVSNDMLKDAPPSIRQAHNSTHLHQ